MEKRGTVSKRLWIALAASLFLAGLFIFIRPDSRGKSNNSRVESPPAKQQEERADSEDLWKEEAITSDSPKDQVNVGGPTMSDLALVVDGDPLVVTLAAHPELGPISIERYDSDGNPTGQPLKSGTKVQIPDPSKPGEKIYFEVP